MVRGEGEVCWACWRSGILYRSISDAQVAGTWHNVFGIIDLMIVLKYDLSFTRQQNVQITYYE